MFPYTAQNADELTFYKGSVINVLSKEGEWWKGEMNGQTGMFPSNYVQPLSDVKVGTTQCKYASNVHEGLWSKVLFYGDSGVFFLLFCFVH